MNRVTRHHVDRRSVALDRLESITVGAALAGVVGTIAFGTLAAFSFSGTATAATVSDEPSVDYGVTPVQPDDDNGSQLFRAAPPRSATGRGGHAATGGSG
jgi:hypothetical protein